MVDLFAAAESNSVAHEAELDRLLSSVTTDEAAKIQEFASWVKENAKISINTRISAVVELLSGESYKTIYQLATERGNLSGRPTEEILREWLKQFYELRTSFDNFFSEGNTSNYGALNAGGCGLNKYGSYCLILLQSFTDLLAQIVYLPGDSLAMASATGSGYDWSRVVDCAASHRIRHQLVARHRGVRLLSSPTLPWPSLVADGEQGFEAIFVGEVSLQVVELVRVSKEEYNRMWSLTFLNFGRSLRDAERALAHEFLLIRRAEMRGRIRVEVVE